MTETLRASPRPRMPIRSMQAKTPRKRMTEQEIRATVDKLANVVRVLSEADADDKSEIFCQLGLKLTYQPGRRIVEAR
jgi:site-specific DNA recombinase